MRYLFVEFRFANKRTILSAKDARCYDPLGRKTNKSREMGGTRTLSVLK